MEKPAPAYRGGEPFVFVSYSHRDEEIVYREIRWLQDQGVNVWYDTHIQAGSEWSDALANAIAGCSRFVFFITPNSVASENCRRELNYAIEEGRSILAVHLRETDVPGGIRLNINNRQAILKHRLDADVYRSSLLQALSNDQVAASEQAEPSRSSPGARRMMLPSVVASIVLIAMALIWLLPREAEQPATREAATELDASSTAVAVLPTSRANCSTMSLISALL